MSCYSIKSKINSLCDEKWVDLCGYEKLNICSIKDNVGERLDMQQTNWKNEFSLSFAPEGNSLNEKESYSVLYAKQFLFNFVKNCFGSCEGSARSLGLNNVKWPQK